MPSRTDDNHVGGALTRNLRDGVAVVAIRAMDHTNLRIHARLDELVHL
jgi:hypothetical protein